MTLLRKSTKYILISPSLETDSSSGVGDDDFTSFEEENQRSENGSLLQPEFNHLANQYEDRNLAGDFIQHTEITSEVDGMNREAEILENQENQTILLPLNTNITQDPDVWARANNIGECSGMHHVVIFYAS